MVLIDQMNKPKRITHFHGSVSDFVLTRGYIVGHFMGSKGFPELERRDVEVAWKHLAVSSDSTLGHFHRHSVEITIVISGAFKLLVNNEILELQAGEFLVVYPETIVKTLEVSEATDVIVVKTPSVPDDKFEIAE